MRENLIDPYTFQTLHTLGGPSSDCMAGLQTGSVLLARPLTVDADALPESDAVFDSARRFRLR